MHIAASKRDLTTMNRPFMKITAKFKYWWRLPISDMFGPYSSGGAQGMYDYTWAHASSSVGVIGALKIGKLLKSFSEDGKETYGFYCMCCAMENKDWTLVPNLEKAWKLTKNSSGILIGGIASNSEELVHATNVSAEQKTCGRSGIVHGQKRWCIRPSLSTITGLWVAEEKKVELEKEI